MKAIASQALLVREACFTSSRVISAFMSDISSDVLLLPPVFGSVARRCCNRNDARDEHNQRTYSQYPWTNRKRHLPHRHRSGDPLNVVKLGTGKVRQEKYDRSEHDAPAALVGDTHDEAGQCEDQDKQAVPILAPSEEGLGLEFWWARIHWHEEAHENDDDPIMVKLREIIVDYRLSYRTATVRHFNLATQIPQPGPPYPAM